MTAKNIFWAADFMTIILGVLTFLYSSVAVGLFAIISAVAVGVAYKKLCDR